MYTNGFFPLTLTSITVHQPYMPHMPKVCVQCRHLQPKTWILYLVIHLLVINHVDSQSLGANFTSCPKPSSMHFPNSWPNHT